MNYSDAASEFGTNRTSFPKVPIGIFMKYLHKMGQSICQFSSTNFKHLKQETCRSMQGLAKKTSQTNQSWLIPSYICGSEGQQAGVLAE